MENSWRPAARYCTTLRRYVQWAIAGRSRLERERPRYGHQALPYSRKSVLPYLRNSWLNACMIGKRTPGRSRRRKYFPSPRGPAQAPWHLPQSIEDGVRFSPQAYSTLRFDNLASSIEMWYLHGPDRTTPYEVTFKAVNDLYNEGYTFYSTVSAC